MDENQIMRFQKMLLQLDEQYKSLDSSMKTNREVKRNLTFYRYLKSFKDMSEAYYLGIAISQDPIEIEKEFGFRMNPRKTQYGSFLIVSLSIPKNLQSLLVKSRFHMNLSVQVNKQRLCRTVPINESNPFKVVMSWTEFPINSELDISFFGKMNTSNIVFRTRKILLSMPFFLKSVKHMEQNRKYRNYRDDLIQISQQYIIHKKCFTNEYNGKYIIIVPNNLKLVDVLRRSFPQHLIRMSDAMLEKGKFHVMRDTSMVSVVNIVKKDSYVEIHSDMINLKRMKEYFIYENYNHEKMELLPIANFVCITYPLVKWSSPEEVYHYLRGLWIRDEWK